MALRASSFLAGLRISQRHSCFLREIIFGVCREQVAESRQQDKLNTLPFKGRERVGMGFKPCVREADMKEYAIEGALPSRHAIGDYLVLAKPGIVSLVMMSSLTGLCIASRGLPDLWLTISVMTGILLVVISLVFLSYAVNSMTAILTGAAASGYVVLYTIILKRRSSYANQVGGIAGALPPVIGYVAVTQRV